MEFYFNLIFFEMKDSESYLPIKPNSHSELQFFFPRPIFAVAKKLPSFGTRNRLPALEILSSTPGDNSLVLYMFLKAFDHDITTQKVVG